ncbi:ATP synthase gamma chain [compost metagenome]
MALNTKEIRQRIKGFKSTQQITKAMELVAAAKVRRVQTRALAARPYAEKIREMFAAVTSQLPVGEVQSQLLTQREVRNVLLIVVTSDKGLAGAYNTNVLRQAVNRAREWREKGIEPQLIVVGTKGVNFFRHSNFKVVKTFQHLPQVPTFTEATLIVEEFTKLYIEGQVDRVEFIHTKFHSMLRYTPEVVTLLPAERTEQAATTGFNAEYVFEPTASEMIDDLIPTYLQTVVYQGMLESSTSFFASQMTAMGAATKNAGELIQHMTLVLNKARQAAITQEISEVVGGAAALKA